MKIATCGIAALVLTAGLASAQTVIDNGQFGVNISSIGGANGSDIYAQSFVVPTDNRLIQFGMWLQGGGQDAPAVRIDLWGNDANNQADENNVLVSGTVHQGNLDNLTRIDTFTSIDLVPGNTYWIVINGLIDQTSGGVYASTWDGGTNTIASGHMDWSNDLGNTWSGGIDNGDFGVYASFVPVPTPGTAGLLALGGLAAMRRRR
ncbi:MAG: hypothetical protein Q9O74_12030 [Planctomycetota bacterium]|nr:hypothetical protein [Planctomycetota bacterium]